MNRHIVILCERYEGVCSSEGNANGECSYNGEPRAQRMVRRASRSSHGPFYKPRRIAARILCKRAACWPASADDVWCSVVPWQPLTVHARSEGGVHCILFWRLMFAQVGLACLPMPPTGFNSQDHQWSFFPVPTARSQR